MKDKVLKRSVCRTVGKVFNVIDIVLDSIFILGAVAMFIIVSIIIKKVGDQGGTAEGKKWLDLAHTIRTWGIVAIVVGCVALLFSIITIRLLKFSVKFAPMFIFGILSILIGVSMIVGIFMIIVSFTECISKKKKQPNLKIKE